MTVGDGAADIGDVICMQQGDMFKSALLVVPVVGARDSLSSVRDKVLLLE